MPLNQPRVHNGVDRCAKKQRTPRNIRTQVPDQTQVKIAYRKGETRLRRLGGHLLDTLRDCFWNLDPNKSALIILGTFYNHVLFFSVLHFWE